VFGSRFGGATGATVALLGLLGPPVVIVTILAVLYAQAGNDAALGRILTGISAAAAGLLIAMVAKMSAPVFRLGLHWSPLIGIIAFVAVGPLHFPLQWVLLVLAPIGIAIAWKRS
jgi:chromate transporter